MNDAQKRAIQEEISRYEDDLFRCRLTLGLPPSFGNPPSSERDISLESRITQDEKIIRQLKEGL